MLGSKFLKINGESIPNPVAGSFKVAYEADETVELSEGGTELGSVRRLNKRTFSGTWQLSSFWLKKFEQWCTSRTVSVTYQDTTYVCRMRGYDADLFNNSEYVPNSDGLWTLSNITMTEI